MPNESYLAECLEKFYELPDIFVLELNHPQNLQILDSISDRYGLDLSFVIILLAINELNYLNLEEYLAKKFDLDSLSAKKIADEIKNLYLEPIINRLSFLNPDPNKTKPTEEEEKAIITDLFKEKLLVELTNYRPTINALNQRIFAWLNRELEAKKKIENALLQNEQVISAPSVTINNETIPGTISNWLRCFATEKGIDNFSSLSISEFLGTSKNTLNLNETEKNLLKNILNIYRNIKFFPESMPNDNGEGWAIIPLPENEPDHLNEILDQEELIIEEEVEDEKEEEQTATPTSTPNQPLNQETTNKLNQLRLLLNRYGENTLEGEAIKEEIAKLEKR